MLKLLVVLAAAAVGYRVLKKSRLGSRSKTFSLAREREGLAGAQRDSEPHRVADPSLAVFPGNQATG